jgi:hypothetical protein
VREIVMFRIAYVLENGSVVGKAAAGMMLFLLIGVPLYFIIYTEIQILIEKIKRHKRNNKKERN